jgi:tetratricopeptide (TPR) repeat protein
MKEVREMNRRRHRPVIAANCALWLLVLCPFPLLAAGQDVVVLEDGRVVSGVTVLHARCDKVEVDRDGNGEPDESIAADIVAEIRYDDVPLAFRQGTSYFEAGRYKDAAVQFEKALGEKDVRSFWLLPDARYMIGECYRRAAGQDQSALVNARHAFQTVLTDSPRERMVPFAVRGLGLCMLAQGEIKAAEAEFQKLLDEGKYGVGWRLRGQLAMAQVRSRQKKHDEAVALCEETIAACKRDKRLGTLAEAVSVQADVLMAAGQFDKVREIHLETVRAAGDRDIRTKARAYNAIGDSYLAQNQADNALLAYLRVRVLYFEDREELPRALYGAARCFAILNRNEEAQDLLRLLEEEHPASAWTARAKNELGG